MEMERIIKVNGWEVVRGLCTVGFNVRTFFGGTEITGHNTMEITHGKAYDMLDTAEKVTIDGEYMVELTFGKITIQMYKQIN